jgi:hypothetical protein
VCEGDDPLLGRICLRKYVEPNEEAAHVLSSCPPSSHILGILRDATLNAERLCRVDDYLDWKDGSVPNRVWMGYGSLPAVRATLSARFDT